MTRTRLPDRRFSVTHRLPVVIDGKERTVLVTVGYDRDDQPREVFCADWKAGTSMHSIVTDCCVLLSLLLQHGYTPAEIAARLGEPPSLVGQLIRACEK